MKIRKIVSSVIATVGIFACVAACGSGNGSSGTTDTKKDKGLPTMGQAITYNPNHLVNGGNRSPLSTGAGATTAQTLYTTWSRSISAYIPM